MRRWGERGIELVLGLSWGLGMTTIAEMRKGVTDGAA